MVISTVRDAAFDLFRRHGIDKVFGNPGSTELPMFREFPDDFEYVLGLQESVVLAMADGYAQATRKPGLVNLHSAAGVGHALGNLFTAYRNQTPLLVTAGQQARSILPYRPFLYAQDAIEFPKPYVKWACEPARAEDVPQALATALNIALQPPCGPVFVSIPIDDWDVECPRLSTRSVSVRRGADPDDIQALAIALKAASNPVIVVGASVALDNAFDLVVDLAEHHDAAVWISPMSARNAFPEDHRLFAGFLPAMREDIVSRLSGHDLVLVLGAPVFTYHVEGDGPHAPEGADLFQITDDPELAACAPVGNAICASLSPALKMLNSKASGASSKRRIISTPVPAPSADTLTDALVCHRLSSLRDPASIVVEEAPSTRPKMQAHLPITQPDTFYTCASGGLGHGLPAAIGVAMGRPDEKVIALLGDGSAMYAIQGLWSAAQAKLPISFIIVRNGAYDALVNFGSRFGLSHVEGAQLPEIDFVGIAQAQGLDARRVTTVAELDRALEWSLAAAGPTLVEIEVIS